MFPRENNRYCAIHNPVTPPNNQRSQNQVTMQSPPRYSRLGTNSRTIQRKRINELWNKLAVAKIKLVQLQEKFLRKEHSMKKKENAMVMELQKLQLEQRREIHKMKMDFLKEESRLQVQLLKLEIEKIEKTQCK